MDPKRWQHVQQLFDEALELSSEERASFLDAACGEDAELRQDVASLLANFSAAGSTFMENPAARIGDDLEMPEMPAKASGTDGPNQPGDRIGPYVLEKLLGTGGVGRVYLATRETEFQKQVAVKLLKRGMDTDELVRRFVSERQILAQLEHPNVANLLDGGATDDGRHYLVMEYVDGLAIDTYCAEKLLDVPQRLRLFLKVCDAVHFAHRNLVVHRDLKPSNILVAQDGEPKLLDFGIAKLLRPESFPQTVLPTAPGWRAMTPEYASPEQVRGGLISTASDVYSLGVVLYELLTGRRPYRLSSRSLIEVERTVCTVPPMRPSRAVTRQLEGEEPASTGTYLGVDRKKLKQRLSGDLDNILLMALEKEPERRYQSVDQLAADLRRHLDNLPVSARKDSLFYRSSKFARRHRLPLAVVSFFALMLLVFVATLVMQQGQILRQRDRAESVSEFLENLFEISDPSRERGESVLARSLLDKGAIDIEARLRDQPGLQGDLLGTMGRSYTHLGLYSEAEDMLQRSLSLRRQSYGDEDPSVATAKYQLADLYVEQGVYDRAEPLAREALQTHLDALGEEHAAVVHDRMLLAGINQRLGNLVKAGQLFLQAEAGARELRDEDLLVKVLSRRGHFELYVGNDTAARGALEEALTIARRLYGETHPEVALILGQLAEIEKAHDFDRAASLLEDAIAIQRRVFHEPHPDLAKMLNRLAVLKKAQGDYVEAEALFNEAMTIQNQVYAEPSIVVASTLNNLAGLKKGQGDLDRAEALYTQSLEIHRRVVGERHPETATIMSNLANLMLTTGRLEQAQQLYTDSLDILLESYGENHIEVANGYVNLGQVAVKQEEWDVAEELLQKGATLIRKIAPQHSELPPVLQNQGYVKEKLGDHPSAEALYLEALEIARKTQGGESLAVGTALTRLAIVGVRREQLNKAEAWGREALTLFESTQERGSEDRLRIRRIVGIVLRDQGRFAEAEALFLQNIEECRDKYGDDLAACERQVDTLKKFYEKLGRDDKAAEVAALMGGS